VSEQPPELAVDGLNKAFPGTRALEDLSMTVEAGEIHAVVGENGAGKTTLLMILSGVYTPDAGRLRVRGKDVAFARPQDAQAAGIGTVFQELSLVEGLTVAENVFASHLPTRGAGVLDRPRMRRETRELLAMLGSDVRPDRTVATLDVGERQVVEIAKALSLRASVLLLDEPTSALSAEEASTLFAVLRRLRDQGIAIVFVSHRLVEVFEIADRVTVLRDGRLVGTYRREDITADHAVRLMVGRELSVLYPQRGGETGSPRLEVRGLRSGPVGPVDLVVHAGEIVGLAGLRGSGRSRLVRAIVAAVPRDAGEILVEGRQVRIRGPWQAVEHGIAFVPADRKEEALFPRMSLARNVVSAALGLVTRLGIVRAGEERRLAKRLMRRLAVRARGADQLVQTLSGGNQQKVALAKWLALEPRVLVVDEPTQGIDVGAKAEVHAFLRELAQGGMAVLMVSSELPELLGMCDRILVMVNGHVRASLAAEGATEEHVLALAAGTSWEAA
jgi:ABC-type sugar transport system ATPase subunit